MSDDLWAEFAKKVPLEPLGDDEKRRALLYSTRGWLLANVMFFWTTSVRAGELGWLVHLWNRRN